MGRHLRKKLIAIFLILAYMIFGTIFYHIEENWSYLNSFYFSGITLTTIGYGDLTPVSNLSKIITVIFAFSGVGIVLYSLSSLVEGYFHHHVKKIIKLKQDIQDLKKRKK